MLPVEVEEDMVESRDMDCQEGRRLRGDDGGRLAQSHLLGDEPLFKVIFHLGVEFNFQPLDRIESNARDKSEAQLIN